jgi:hypothetical protein
MTFNPSGFRTIGVMGAPASGPTATDVRQHHSYVTPDSLADIEAVGYFDELRGPLIVRVGDLLDVAYLVDGAIGRRGYVLSAVKPHIVLQAEDGAAEISGQSAATVGFSITPGASVLTYTAQSVLWRKRLKRLDFHGRLTFKPTDLTGASGGLVINTNIPYAPLFPTFNIVNVALSTASWVWPAGRSQAYAQMDQLSSKVFLFASGTGVGIASFGTTSLTLNADHTIDLSGWYNTAS